MAIVASSSAAATGSQAFVYFAKACNLDMKHSVVALSLATTMGVLGLRLGAEGARIHQIRPNAGARVVPSQLDERVRLTAIRAVDVRCDDRFCTGYRTAGCRQPPEATTVGRGIAFLVPVAIENNAPARRHVAVEFTTDTQLRARSPVADVDKAIVDRFALDDALLRGFAGPWLWGDYGDIPWKQFHDRTFETI